MLERVLEPVLSFASDALLSCERTLERSAMLDRIVVRYL
jgi:hypothetical protein